VSLCTRRGSFPTFRARRARERQGFFRMTSVSFGYGAAIHGQRGGPMGSCWTERCVLLAVRSLSRLFYLVCRLQQVNSYACRRCPLRCIGVCCNILAQPCQRQVLRLRYIPPPGNRVGRRFAPHLPLDQSRDFEVRSERTTVLDRCGTTTWTVHGRKLAAAAKSAPPVGK